MISSFSETLRNPGGRLAGAAPIVLEIIKLVNNIMGT